MMRAGIMWLDLTGRRLSVISYTLGMALYALIVVVLYPAFKDSTSLDKFIQQDPTAAALFGVSGTISSSGGWLNGNIYANLFPLVMLLVTIGYGAASLAGQDEDGTLGLMVTLPVRRTIIVLQKVGAMALQGAAVAAAVAVCVLVGRWFDLSVATGNVLAVSGAVLLMAMDFGLAAMAVGARTGRRGEAIGVASVLAAASYLVSSLAQVVSWLRPARYVSLFYWSVGNNQITSGVGAVDYVVLLTVGLFALYAVVTFFGRLDVH